MYKIVNDQGAVPSASVDLNLSSRPLHGVSANGQKLVTVRWFTEDYRHQPRAKNWTSVRRVISWLLSTVQEPADLSHLAVGVQLVGVTH